MNVSEKLRSLGVEPRQVKHFRRYVVFTDVIEVNYNPFLKQMKFITKKGITIVCYDMSKQTVNGMIRYLK